MHKDTIVGIVGAVILVAAMVGVFLYERASPAAQLGAQPGGSGLVALVTQSGPNATGSSAVGQDPSPQTVMIDYGNLTNVTFTVAWRPGQNSQDTVSVTVTPPNGTAVQSPSSSTSPITVTVPIDNAKPTSSTPEMKGYGAWKVAVKFVSATVGTPAGGGLPVSPPGGALTDSSISWNLGTSLQFYQAK